MEFWQYLLLLLLVAIAPLGGMLLARVAPDERELGEKWFVLFRYTLIAAIGVLLLWSARLSAIAATGTVASVLFFLATSRIPLLHHAIVGIAFWFSAKQAVFPALVLALFLLGLVGGTLAASPRALGRKRFWEPQLQTFIRTAWPVLVVLPLYLL